MTFAYVGTLGAVPGKRDELVQHLVRQDTDLGKAGCLLYNVGINSDQPDTVFVVELWTSEDAHRDSLSLPSVQEAIAAARPLLSGEFGGYGFDLVGSPLHE